MLGIRIGGALLLVHVIGCTRWQSTLLPPEIARIATKAGCEQIDDFYDRPGTVGPLFVYGEGEMVFWCRSRANQSRYRLVAHGDWSGCPALVVESRDYPGGLSLARESEPLDGYVAVDGECAAEPAGAVVVISSMYDGVGSRFYCRNGCWMVRRWD